MWSFICLGLVACHMGHTAGDPEVTIAQGTVIGSFNSYFEFYGIPYADSTSGEYRFQAPRPPPIFETPFVANDRDIKCVRPVRHFGYEGVEDCLTVNVITPTLNQTDRLPVMVWIKGSELDSFTFPDFTFSNFIEKDVVIVTPNYRESIFGFLCLGTPEVPGNAGLKDIIAALQWIQQNIAAFGGDPDNVTVFGHGSGAGLVDLLTLSQMSKGLIHRAIAQSGTAMAPWAVTRDNLKTAINVAEALGHTITYVEDLSNAFRRASVAAIAAVINELELTDNSLPFAPCLEREVSVDVEPFLSKSPYEILNAGEQLQIPFMTGFVDREGTIRANEAIQFNWLEKMQQSFSDFLQPDLCFTNDTELNEVTERIKTFYFGDDDINMTTVDNYLEFHGDTMILVPAIREARLRAATNSSVYLYQFSYKGSLGSLFQGPLIVEESAHSDELSYFFHENIYNITSPIDLTVMDILVERWTNFAKTSVPSSETSVVEWEPVTRHSLNYLRVLHDLEINRNESGSLDIELVNPHPVTMSFWLEIYDHYFKDAKGRWSVQDRNEEDDEIIVVDNEGNGNGTNPGAGDDGNGDEGNDDDENSASMLISYTFGIIILYSVLSMLHMSIILS